MWGHASPGNSSSAIRKSSSKSAASSEPRRDGDAYKLPNDFSARPSPESGQISCFQPPAMQSTSTIDKGDNDDSFVRRR